jgi:hypothetical protein
MLSLAAWWRIYIEGDPFADLQPRTKEPQILSLVGD